MCGSLVMIDISEIDTKRYLSNEGRREAVGCRIRLKSGELALEFKIGQPREVCSPVVFREDNGPQMLGFISSHVNHIQDLRLYKANYGLVSVGALRLLGCAWLNDVEKIEFYGPIASNAVQGIPEQHMNSNGPRFNIGTLEMTGCGRLLNLRDGKSEK